ncbi:hypothetical protein KJ765_06095 [Candidatus Micrarchaeota archaeon]|nr:hypothetical protein [Candidatus Micrarchaeota archaeon]
MNARLKVPGLASLLILLLFSTPAFATCTFLEVDAITSLAVQQGVQAVFPITIRHNGANQQPVYISAQNPDRLPLQFDESAYVLTPGEEKTFNLIIETETVGVGEYEIPIEISADEGYGSCYEYETIQLAVETSSTPTPEPLDSVAMSIDPKEARQVFPGEILSYDIRVHNNYNEEIIVELDAPDNPFSSSTSFAEKVFRIPARSSKVVRVRVTIPPGTPGSIYDLVFRAEVNTACCIQELIVPASISVFGENARLSVFREPYGCVSVKQGETYNMELGIQNDGGVRGPYTMEVLGEPESTRNVQLQVRRFELMEGERTYVNVSIRPPENEPQEIKFFTLRIRYLDFSMYETAFCYRVQGTKDIEIEKPVEINAKRCSTESFEFSLKNIGSLEDTYAIETRPMRGASVFVDPQTFTLRPSERQRASVVLGVSCLAPLGLQNLEARIIGSEFTRSELFEVRIAPNETRQLFLKLTAPKTVRVVEGIPTEFTVSVFNTLSVPVDGTFISIEGIPDEWVEIEGAKTIRSASTAQYKVRVHTEITGDFPISIIAASGLEKSRVSSTLLIEPQVQQLDYAYQTDFAELDGEVQEVRVFLTVTNLGNVVLNDILVSTSAEDVNVIPIENIASLAPGESRSINAVVRPLQDTSEKLIPLRLKSTEGAVQTKSIALPALRRADETTPFDFPWKIVAIIVVLVLIFAVLAKSDDGAVQV